ncbi:MotA/TolQ/ExbB proton channel family protein [Aureivirga sp. CE67]|uniref:MotA/TolQ/ExbB proton channel family protein n=1 Tax=Aureivirga sp. CE67 TaxID=1788983 RepID=UPI0018C9B1EA|nr:MotA/TolQ/ExbB proton channel family protein [Aureivirga sp. CE67]
MILNFLEVGGPIFMYPALIILILIIILIVKSFVNPKGKTQKNRSLISNLGTFAIVWGFLGQLLGLISAFDTIDKVGKVSTSILAGGLKVSLVAPTFGLVIFLIARIGIILLDLKSQNNLNKEIHEE